MMTTPGPDHATHSNVFERHRRKTLFLVVLVSVLVTDFVAGLFFLPKSYSSFREPHPYYHHGLLPNREARSKWGSGEEYTVFTNSLGLIDEAVREVSLSTDKHRIVFIGDSYTEGIGVPFEKTFVGRLSEKVDRDRVEILNAGVSSYCAKLYYLKTKYLVEEVGLEFDELYVFIDISDIQDEVLYRDFQSRKRTRLATLKGRLHRFLRQTSFFYGTIQPALFRRRAEERRSRYETKFYPPWLDYFWLDDINEEGFDDPDFLRVRDAWTLSVEIFNSHWTQEGLESAVNTMAELVEFCRDHEIKLTIAVYPWIIQVDAGDRNSYQVQIWREFTRRGKIDFIDLFPTLVTHLPFEEFRDRYILPGDAHWNADGHALVADRVWEHMEESLRQSGVLPNSEEPAAP
jgi:lysophospholipase L1-like esterase